MCLDKMMVLLDPLQTKGNRLAVWDGQAAEGEPAVSDRAWGGRLCGSAGAGVMQSADV